MLTAQDRNDIEQLLYKEAHLLDEGRFEEWLDLLTDDVEYVMPLTEHVQGKVEPAGHPIIKDDKTMLMARVAKNATGFSHVEIPTSMTCHIVSNVYIEEAANGEAAVKSSFMVRQARKLRDEAWWVGRRHDRIRLDGDGWRIAYRCIYLDATVLPRGVSIFF
ncbi:MAG: aromatic-ring-hydroxylating dioxygenase subunit beta [Acidimicrobiales bacterium]